ncbi:hypothetical protein CAI21_03615 [Alkalilimnicola ehrlichii]|uniref:alanine-zipper protein n=1 Tax=Alkalilimnicola ehrlichii TaxID=351052 RepID=UPI000E2F61AE|nr:alanine-zipper protein [Alkalilimnicola ehrlichii]RFA31063.1 hypothetical protein CAI21_03615 [Alkalilimnicola ehrlichii]
MRTTRQHTLATLTILATSVLLSACGTTDGQLQSMIEETRRDAAVATHTAEEAKQQAAQAQRLAEDAMARSERVGAQAQQIDEQFEGSPMSRTIGFI